MPTTTNKGLSTPAYNSQSGLWGTQDLNGNSQILDNNLAGLTSVALSNANVTLSAAQAQNLTISLTGTLLANVTVSTPCLGFFWVVNNTTGNYTVSLQANFGAGAVGSSVLIPQGGVRQLFVSDATNGLQYGAPPPSIYLPGEIKAYAGSSAPSGWLLCYGQLISRTLYAPLYAVIGTTYGAGDGSTFAVPDLRGRTIAGLDNMGGSAANRLDWATTLGTAGGEENHTLSNAELPSHSHTINDPGHFHTYYCAEVGIQLAWSGGYNWTFATQTTGSAYTGITGTNSAGLGGAHNNMQPTILLNYIIRAL